MSFAEQTRCAQLTHTVRARQIERQRDKDRERENGIAESDKGWRQIMNEFFFGIVLYVLSFDETCVFCAVNYLLTKKQPFNLYRPDFNFRVLVFKLRGVDRLLN